LRLKISFARAFWPKLTDTAHLSVTNNIQQYKHIHTSNSSTSKSNRLQN